MNTNTNITPEIAHDGIIKSFGKDGFYALNDYYELRCAARYGVRRHGRYAPWENQDIPGSVIEDALKMMDGELIISIRRLVTKKGRVVWGLDILPMGPGFVCGWEYGIMRTGYDSIEDCLNAIETRKDAIVEKAIESKGLYITGDKDAVDEVAKLFDNPICFYN